jgi:hypothetical protein
LDFIVIGTPCRGAETSSQKRATIRGMAFFQGR